MGAKGTNGISVNKKKGEGTGRRAVSGSKQGGVYQPLRWLGWSQVPSAAEELRAAAHALGRLLGLVDVEDILDVVFREFCIGK